MAHGVSAFDLTSAEFRADPHPILAAMRREMSVYSRVTDSPLVWGRGTIWYPLRYDDSVAVLRDSRRFVKDYRLAFDASELADMPPEPGFAQRINASLISREAPEHTRLRKLVQEAFSPAMVQSRRSRISALTEDLLDRHASRGEMDLIADLAFLLPLRVITEILGLPASEGELMRRALSAVPQTSEELERVTRDMKELVALLRQQIAERRRQPRDDLISALIAVEVDGDRLSEEDILTMIQLLVGSGFETTMNLIGNGVLALLQHPAQCERLCREPARIELAVEEMLRYDGPLFTATPRWAVTDVEIRGHRIRRGDRVSPMVLAANRDPERFPEPDVFDITRQDNRHIAFGMGVHYCLGGPLARQEAQIAINAILRRLPGLRLKGSSSELRWARKEEIPFFHGLEALDVAWDP